MFAYCVYEAWRSSDERGLSAYFGNVLGAKLWKFWPNFTSFNSQHDRKLIKNMKTFLSFTSIFNLLGSTNSREGRGIFEISRSSWTQHGVKSDMQLILTYNKKSSDVGDQFWFQSSLILRLFRFCCWHFQRWKLWINYQWSGYLRKHFSRCRMGSSKRSLLWNWSH